MSVAQTGPASAVFYIALTTSHSTYSYPSYPHTNPNLLRKCTAYITLYLNNFASIVTVNKWQEFY